MPMLKDCIKREIAEWDRLSSKRKVQVLLEKSDLSDPAIRRLLIIGGIVKDYFPELHCLRPQKSEHENEIEFAPVSEFFNLLSFRRNLLHRLLKRKAVETQSNQN